MGGNRSRHCRPDHRGLGPSRGARDRRRQRSGAHRRLRRRPHAPRVHQALGRRVRPRRTASWDDGGGRGPARDRQRLRRSRHRRLGRGVGQASVHLRDLGAELCAGISFREPGRRVLHRGADRAPRQAWGDRNCRSHELPRCRERRPRGPRQDRDRRPQARRRPRARRCRLPTGCLPRRRRRVRPRVHRARRGRGEAPQRHVDLHPGGFRVPQPRGLDRDSAPPRDRSDRALHR